MTESQAPVPSTQIPADQPDESAGEDTAPATPPGAEDNAAAEAHAGTDETLDSAPVEPETVTVPAVEWTALSDAQREQEDRLLRLHAEFENYRKRVAKERVRMRETTVDEITRAFLSVVDNFDRALAAAAEYELDAEHLTGWQLVHQQLYDVLDRFGVKPMAVVGQPFNPQFHDALAEIEAAGVPPGHVAAEVERGYMAGDRVLRTAKVTVCRAPADPGPADA